MDTKGASVDEKPRQVRVETFVCQSCVAGRFVVNKSGLSGFCLNCGKKDIEDGSLKKLRELKDKAAGLLEQGKLALAEGRRLDAEEVLLEGLREAERVVHRKDELLIELKGSLVAVYTEMSKWPEALELTRERLELFKELYGEETAQVAEQRLKLAGLLWEHLEDTVPPAEVLVVARECLVATSKAQKIVESEQKHKPEDPKFEEMMKTLKERLVYCLLLEQQLTSQESELPLDQENLNSSANSSKASSPLAAIDDN